MTIQFSQQELTEIRRYLDNIKSGETRQQPELDTEGNRLFLLLRKLLAYGVHQGVQIQTDPPTLSYPTLQKKSQKPNDMQVIVRAYFSQFDRLLTSYIADHQDK